MDIRLTSIGPYTIFKQRNWKIHTPKNQASYWHYKTNHLSINFKLKFQQIIPLSRWSYLFLYSMKFKIELNQIKNTNKEFILFNQ